jgi:hypothetical protein
MYCCRDEKYRDQVSQGSNVQGSKVQGSTVQGSKVQGSTIRASSIHFIWRKYSTVILHQEIPLFNGYLFRSAIV